MRGSLALVARCIKAGVKTTLGSVSRTSKPRRLKAEPKHAEGAGKEQAAAGVMYVFASVSFGGIGQELSSGGLQESCNNLMHVRVYIKGETACEACNCL